MKNKVTKQSLDNEFKKADAFLNLTIRLSDNRTVRMPTGIPLRRGEHPCVDYLLDNPHIAAELGGRAEFDIRSADAAPVDYSAFFG